MPAIPAESDFVFNVVVTPGTFRYLQLFTRSLLAHSDVRLRLAANGCTADDIRSLEAFRREYGSRVELLELSRPTMVPHGVALDEVYDTCNDGRYFCFVDSDVKAKQPFMAAFVELLERFDVVTSCDVAWSDDTVLPAGSRDLAGRHAVGHDGFVYGASFLAIYPRAAVERVRELWAVTFRTYPHETLPPAVQARLAESGRQFRLYDTAKVLNILLQIEGFTLEHFDNPALFHLGGISQYLSDPSVLRQPSGAPGGEVPWFAASGAGRERWDFARWAAAMLQSIVDGEPPPELPAAPEDRARAIAVQRELLDLARDGDVR